MTQEPVLTYEHTRRTKRQRRKTGLERKKRRKRKIEEVAAVQEEESIGATALFLWYRYLITDLSVLLGPDTWVSWFASHILV